MSKQTITNKFGLPQELVNAVIRDEYDFVREDGKYSVSELVSPSRQVILYRRYGNKIVRDVSDYMFRVLGKAIHHLIESGAVANGLQEERLESAIAGGVLSGKMDIYRDNAVIDVKATSVWTLYHNPKGRDEWLWQTNAYAWLLRQHGFPVDKIQIFAILLGWNRRESATKESYPRSPMTMIDIEVLPHKGIEKWLTERMAALLECEKLPDNKLPLCEERWSKDVRCREYCDVCEYCPYWKEKYSNGE